MTVTFIKHFILNQQQGPVKYLWVWAAFLEHPAATTTKHT